MRKIIVLTLISFIIFHTALVFSMEMPDISAASAIVIDNQTGAVIYQKNPDAMKSPASLTKIISAYIIFEELEKGTITLDTKVRISKTAAFISTNRNYQVPTPMKEGEHYTVGQLLELLFLPSSASATYALAEHISGSEAAFLQRMNAKYEELGLTGAFTNTSGAWAHYTTARSLASFIRYFIGKYPEVLHYTSLQSTTFNGKVYKNTNQFIQNKNLYSGVNGFKTGTSSTAGYCIAVTAVQNNASLISVVLDASTGAGRYTDSKKLLDYSFGMKQGNHTDLENTTFILNAPGEVAVPSVLQVKSYALHTQPLQVYGRWLIDGAVVKTIDGEYISNAVPLNLEHYIAKASGSAMTLSLVIDVPGKAAKQYDIPIKISGEPAK